MRTILWLKIKMLKQNFGFLAIMLFMGLLLTFFFGASMGKPYRPVIFIADQENTDVSNELVNGLMDNDTFKFIISDTTDKAFKEVENNRGVAAVIIEKGFTDSREDTKNEYITIMRQQEFMEVVQLENILSTKIMEMNNAYKIADLLYEYSKEHNENIKEDEYKAQIIDKMKINWKYKKTVVTNTSLYDIEESFKYDSLIHSMIGFTIFFTTFPILFNMADILNDKKKKTFGRILISPKSKYQYLLGNLIFTFVIGLLMISIFVVLGNFLFGINWGNQIFYIMLVFAAFTLCMTCLSLFVSGFIKTYAQLSAISPIILTSLGMLGGCMWPLEIVNNPIMLFLADITPHKWAVQSIEYLVYYNTGIDTAIKSITVLLAMSCIYFVLGLRALRTE